MKAALRSAKEDHEWEREMDDNSLKSGEIRITMNSDGFQTRGAGISQVRAISPPTTPVKKRTPVKPISKAAIPAIASKTVKALDVVNAASQDANFGVELSTITRDKGGEETK